MNSEIRQNRHGQASALMNSGSYAGAVAMLKETLITCGPHVGLLSDLAGAAYLNGDMGEFVMAVERLEAEFDQCREMLSERSLIQTLIALAKWYEELGRIADAFDRIDEALEIIPAGTPLALRTRCQRLRLLSSFGREDEVAELYRHCALVSESLPHTLIECAHALLLAETRLFGLDHAWPRFGALMARTDLSPADLRLNVIDLLEIAVERDDREAQARLLKFADTLPSDNFDIYEKQVLACARGPGGESEPTAAKIFAWSNHLAPFGFMRILALQIPRSQTEREALQKKFFLAVQSHDHRTQKILHRKWASLLRRSDVLKLNLNGQNQTVGHGENHLSFRASPLSWQLLQSLSEGETTISALLARLEKSGESEQNLETVRIALLRLNRKLSAFLAVDWVIKFRKSGILVNDQVLFQKAR